MAKKKQEKDLRSEMKDSAHKVWLAGLGAFAVAEDEGSKFFKKLVDKGEDFEARSKKRVDEMVGKVKDVREDAESRWERFAERFDDRVAKSIERLGVPSREEIHKLTRRVEQLTRKIDDLQKPATKAAKTTKSTKSTRARKSA